jgi:hypothetical protein
MFHRPRRPASDEVADELAGKRVYRFVQRGEIIRRTDEIRDQDYFVWRPVHRKHVGQRAVQSEALRREITDVRPPVRALLSLLVQMGDNGSSTNWDNIKAYMDVIEKRLDEYP